MNIVIAGAGEVGLHSAQVLGAAGHNVVVVDLSSSKLELLSDRLDVRTLQGNAAQADVLAEAGTAGCDLLVAATAIDEINLLCAAVGKAIGAKKCVARVHHSAFFEQRGLDYRTQLGVDVLICPEYITSQVISRMLRNPGALAVENFARGEIEVQELVVSRGTQAVDKSLKDVRMPPGVRLAQVRRGDVSFIPAATTVIQPDDVVMLIGERARFEHGRKLFTSVKFKRKHVVIMGGSAMGVWQCRALKQQLFSVRLFERDRERAEELSEKLSNVTVIQADPTDPDVFNEERVGEADAFIATTRDDQHNVLACVQAKQWGVDTVVAVVQRAASLDLVAYVGIDAAFCPRMLAAKEIQRVVKTGRVRQLATLAAETTEVYEISPTAKSEVIGKELRNLKLPTKCIIGAIQRNGAARVPGADDAIQVDDLVLMIGPTAIEKQLRKLFAPK